MQAVYQKGYQKTGVQCQSVTQGRGIRSVGVVGARDLVLSAADQVGNITEDLIDRGYRISSGGAVGTDQFCIERVLRLGRSDHTTIYAPWKNYSGFPIKVRAMMRQFRAYGGSIVWGISSGQEPRHVLRVAYLQRNVRIVQACYGLVAFLTPASRGTLFTLSQAIKNHLVIVVFPMGCELPQIESVLWRPIRCGGVWDGSYKAVYLK